MWVIGCIVYLPQYERVSTPTEYQHIDQRERVLSSVRELGISVIDVAAAFEEYEDPLALFPFRLAGHYNATGYRLMAETILRDLDENKRRD